MMDLIGRPYRLGADGTDPDGALDCIHLVYEVLSRLGIRTPPFNAAWYDASGRRIARDLLRWGQPINRLAYDGDIAVMLQSPTAFSVTWQAGIFHINQHLSQVAWCPIDTLQACHCFRSRSN
jgi:hypothetical protein